VPRGPESLCLIEICNCWLVFYFEVITKMKWFKHISDSLDDPFIFSLMEEFKSDGYLVFFGIIEIYAREFKTKVGWKLTVTRAYLKRKLCKRQTTLVIKILKYIKNSGKWDIEFFDDKISIYIPKFKDLMDESTIKKLRAKEKSFRNDSGSVPKSGTTELELEVEEDKEEDKDINTSSEPRKTLDSEPVKKVPIMVIPLIKRDGNFTVFQEDVDQWQETFPGIDVIQLLRKIKQWNLDNPSKRKTKAGIRKHISAWLGKEQDKNGGVLTHLGE